MKIGHIVPKGHLDLMDLGDFDFALAHLALGDVAYREYFGRRAKQGRVCFLDNGVWETGQPVDSGTMINLAFAMHATYVYAPDFLNESDRTVDAVRAFCERVSYLFRKRPDFPSRIVAVAQGKTRGDWYNCAWQLSHIKLVDLVAIPALMIEDMCEHEQHYGLRLTKTRLELCHLISRNIHEFGRREFYATGTGAALCARELSTFPWFFGIDTTMACLLASMDVSVEDMSNFKPKVKLDFDVELSERQIEIAKSNIFLMNKWAHGGEC